MPTMKTLTIGGTTYDLEGGVTSVQGKTGDVVLTPADLKFLLPTDTASGAVASFPDGADGVPVESLSCAITPVQDLHGQSSPYPAGSTKNLFKATPYSGTYNGSVGVDLKGGTGMPYSITSDGYVEIDVTTAWKYRLFATDALSAGTYTAETWANANTIRATIYVTDSNLLVKSTLYNHQSAGQGTAQTVTVADGDRIAVSIGSNEVTKIKTKFQAESGATATTEVPFENLCPITGFSQAVVTRTGKNLCVPLEIGTFAENKAAGTDYSTMKSTNAARMRTESLIYINGQQIAVSFDTSTYQICGTLFDANGLYLGQASGFVSWKSAVFTPTYNASYIALAVKRNNGANMTDADKTAVKLQVEFGSSATDYESPSIQTLTIDLDGTRYGGTLDVLTGVLTVTHALIEYDGSADEQWAKHTSGSASAYAMDMNQIDAYGYTGEITIKANYLESILGTATWGNYDGFISQTGLGSFTTGIKSITTVADWKTYLSSHPLQVLYKLKDSYVFTVQLTANQLTTLYGQNNVWCNTGDTALTYRADIGLYIDKKTS